MNAPDFRPLPGALQLSRTGEQTLAEQLAAHYATHIRHRLIAAGTRLPSVRDGARRHGVSPHTVVAAYDQLLAQGLVEARRQRGFFVREQRRELPATPPGPPSSPPRAPVDASALIRGMLGENSRRPGPGLGTLPASWLDLGMLQAAMRRVLADERDDDRDATALHYGDPAGDARLRAALCGRIADFGVRAQPGQIVTAVGATQALDLISRALLTPGDAVLVDEPGWSVEYARLTQLGMRLLPVPRGPDGPDLAVLDTLAREHRPRLYVTVSVLHNPTGGMLSLASAHRLLQLAQAHDIPIVEDDTYAHLAPAHAPRLAALDDLQRTFYVSGFSKILAPGWRVGFVAAPPAWVDRLIDLKLLTSLTTPSLLERAVAVCLEQGQLRRHAERVMARLDAARTRSVRLALDAGCEFVCPPQGLFGWVETGIDTEPLAQRLLDDGWLTAPGCLFHPRRQPSTRMRINFATAQDAAFWHAFVTARDAMRR
jgi:DNA-binding transcriptional MocR family regulator